ncbi:regulatory protein RecX [Coxiella burnetii]|uniref:regulatory protein RecX n=1 Tax=Coxiella burnetii TaxID=777 RepID=UPI0000ECFF48|nr:regulatory protein RecX [Coxiella burnetii]ACJ20037.1 regulatory protein [Coxiella burnetii CbuK_Q154]ATN85679.1 recombinase RecX [Coxiella burnetii str. Schperling]EAX33806.1 recombinase RecX [Coxiella burnetii 'MSU Goat Q177']EDR36400.1 regulatory protein RecX [Coxiella burnetii Q321]PHH56799.1 recombinase RecX [Coxiella burnetii]
MTDLRNRAISFLARREHSQEELKRKLVTRGYKLPEIETELASLAREGLQSDERYAEAYVRQRIESGFGHRRIIAELQQRGIENSLIQQYLPRDESFWFETLSSVWKNKYGYQSVKGKPSANQVRFLLQRGFDLEQIYKLFKKNE